MTAGISGLVADIFSRFSSAVMVKNFDDEKAMQPTYGTS